MILKISPTRSASGHVRTMSAVTYNMNKVREGTAELLEMNGIPSAEEARQVFERLENGSRGDAKETCLHMSLNPKEGEPLDRLDDGTVRRLVHDIMDRLGYGEQPWMLFKHIDTGRVHYHIVSSRIGRDGYKIPSFQERRRAKAVIKDLQPSYGYTITRDEIEVKEERKAELDGRKKRRRPAPVHVKRFDPALPVVGQIESIVLQAAQWRFTTREQFIWILSSMGIHAETDMGRILYSGMNARGQRCTGPVFTAGHDLPGIETIDRLAGENREKRQKYGKVKQRVASLSTFALEKAENERHFLGILHRTGIDAFISRDIDGKVFGITYVDHRTRCCWKASEVANAAGVTAIRKKYDDGVWEPFRQRDVPETEGLGKTPRLKADLPGRSPHSPAQYTPERLQEFVQRNEKLCRDIDEFIRKTMASAHAGIEDEILDDELTRMRKMEEMGL